MTYMLLIRAEVMDVITMDAVETPRHLPRNKAPLQVRDIHQLHLGEVNLFSY